jgi:hypothetical protein
MAKEFSTPAIIIKDGPRKRVDEFRRDHDKGSRRPAFCYPRNIEDLKSEVDKAERFLASNPEISPERKAELSAQTKKKRERLESIQEQVKDVRKEVKTNGAYWQQRLEEFKTLIQENSPSRTDIKEKRVSPWAVHRMEKGLKKKIVVPSTKEAMTLEEIKVEYQGMCKMMDEDSNVGYVQRN